MAQRRTIRKPKQSERRNFVNPSTVELFASTAAWLSNGLKFSLLVKPSNLEALACVHKVAGGVTGSEEKDAFISRSV